MSAWHNKKYIWSSSLVPGTELKPVEFPDRNVFVILKGPLLSTSEFLLMNDLGGAPTSPSDGVGHHKAQGWAFFFN